MENKMTEEYKGYRIEIVPDDDPINPRDWDQLGTMVCFHNRYNLGDKHDLKAGDFNGWDSLENYIRKELEGYIILPLYLYDHSGITMNTTGFSCGWDSGQVGFIYITAEKIRHEYSAKRISKKLKERITGYLVNEVEEYDQFITGDVWGYQIYKGDSEEESDSCWGHFGEDYCLKTAKEAVDVLVEADKENEMVRNIPEKDLPLHINDEFKYTSSKEIFQKRLEEMNDAKEKEE